MKRMIVFLGMICMATSAMAFGGGGGGHDSTKYNRHNPGVDNFGVHIHPDNPPLDIRFYDIKDDANAQPCQAGANVYCCKAGYVVDVGTSKCVACPSGSVATLEENFKCTVCAGEMIPNQDKSSCIMPEPTCEGTGNGCQKCDENGNMVADETLNGQPCALIGNTQGTCVAGECCPGNRLNGDTCCDANFAAREDGCVQACDENDFLSPGSGYCCVTQGEGVGYLAYFPLFVKAEKEYVLDPSCGGCPDSGTYVAANGKDYCCKNGYSYDIQAGQYQNYNPGICGCPYSESDSNVYRFEDATSPSGYLCCLNDNGGWMPWSYYENPTAFTQKDDGYHVNTAEAMGLAFGCQMLSQQ